MKTRALLVSIALTTLCVPAIRAATTPVGCPDLEILSNTLKVIGSRNWNEVSEAALRSAWPDELGTLDCNDKECRTLWQNGGVLDDDCECCGLFSFDTDRDDQGVEIKERLYSIVIYYSNPDRQRTLEAARDFARDMGAPDSTVSKISQKPQQQMYWIITRGRTEEVTLMEVHVKHRQRVWRVYTYISRHPA